jgi:hypothetical protein
MATPPPGRSVISTQFSAPLLYDDLRQVAPLRSMPCSSSLRLVLLTCRSFPRRS